MRLAPEWEEAHHVYGRALELASWSKDWDELVDGARADQAWLETLRWAELARERRPALWRSGETPRPRRCAPRPSGARRQRSTFASATISSWFAWRCRPTSHGGARATVRYVWRALRPVDVNYTARVHVVRPGELGGFGQDHQMGGDFGTGRARPSRRPWSCAFPRTRLPARTRSAPRSGIPPAPGTCRFAASDRPHQHRTVTVADLTVR